MEKLLIVLFSSCLYFTTIAQTIVSTTPQNKKIFLEEFTGSGCSACPSGHAIAKSIKDANPGNAFIINIHTGSYATPSGDNPDFRSPFGPAIAGQANLAGYPSGTVNRGVFAGISPMNPGGTALGRESWSNASNRIKQEPSYVNLAATATINVVSRLLTVHVEGYYTGNSPVATNNLNVVINQNNSLGPQSAGNAGNNYNHQHRLVHMITDQWGESITTTTTGTFVDRTFTYTIPALYNNVSADIANLEVLAFISEGNQKIISGNEAPITFTGLATKDVKFIGIKPILAQCNNSLNPSITIQNNGQTALTSLPITYNINSLNNQVYNWTGNLTTLQKATFTIPNITYNALENNTFNINVPADGDITNNNGSINFKKAALGTNNVTLSFTINTDPQETSWNIKNSVGAIIASGGDYGPDVSLVEKTLTLPSSDCYSFNIFDSFGDGIGTNSVTIKDSNGAILFFNDTNYGYGMSDYFKVSTVLATNTFESSTKLKLYPNPSTGIVKIASENEVQVRIIDLLGKVVYINNNTTNNSNMDLSNLSKGIYLVKITGENINSTEKLILK